MIKCCHQEASQNSRRNQLAITLQHIHFGTDARCLGRNWKPHHLSPFISQMNKSSHFPVYTC